MGLHLCAGAFELCVGDECALGAGTCFADNSTPGCESVACCTIVCLDDPFCCDTEWDAVCAGVAAMSCSGPGCGDDASGSCFEPNGTLGCDDPDCCFTVCTLDGFCCGSSWDEVCVDVARTACGVTGRCCLSDGSGGFSCVLATGPEDCTVLGGLYNGDGTTCDAPCVVVYACTADCAPPNSDGTFGNGDINIDDIVAIINNIGDCPPNTQPCPWDCTPVNSDGTIGNGSINIDDVITVLNQFGDGCGP